MGLYPGTSEIEVWLTSGVNNPGAIIETFNFEDIPTGPSILMANSSMHPILTPLTTYWLVASAPNSDTWAYWCPSKPPVTGTVKARAGTDPWDPAGTTLCAFRLKGSAYVEPIPAPGAIVLGGIGAGLVSWMRRRRAI